MNLNLKGALTGIFKRPKALLASCAVSMALCITAYAVIFGDYAARARIAAKEAVSGEEGTAGVKVSDKAMRTTAELIKSRFLMEEVVKELNLEDAFGGADAAAKLLSAVKARPVRGTDIIEISVRLKRPELAAQIANTICKIIITDSARERFSFEKDVLSWLSEQSASIRKELEDATERLREFKKAAGVVDLAAEHDAVWMRIEGLRSNLAAAKTQKQDVEAEYNEIKGYLEAGAGLEEIPFVENDQEYKKLKSEYEKYSREKNELLSKYQPSHPLVVEIDEKLSKAGLELPAYAKKIVDGVIERYETPRAKEEQLSKLIKKENDALLELEEKLDEYNALTDEVKEKETAYKAFLKRIEDGLGTGALRIRQVKLIEQAYIPRKKEGPSLFLMILIGLAAGLVSTVVYNAVMDKNLTLVKKPDSAALKDKGMYIERVKDENQEK